MKERIKQLLPILTDAEIARQVNCSREYIRQVREKIGIQCPKKWAQCRKTITEDQLTEAVNLLGKMPVVKIATKLNIQYQTLRLTLREGGFNIPHKFWGRKADPEMFKFLFVLYENKYGTVKRIAKEMNVSPVTISRLKKKYLDFP